MTTLEKIKVQSLSWNSDTEPENFWMFINSMDALVEATEGGSRLVSMCDSKLGRVKHNAKLTPSFISDDPDFAPTNAAGAQPVAPDAEGTGEGEATTGDTGDVTSLGSGGSHFSLGRHWESYEDFPDGVKELDR